MDVSVIIPSYNSRYTIERCLTALVNQKSKFSHELIVVDSSSDGTAELIESRFSFVKLKRLSHRMFPGPARNVGTEMARGKIFAFTDSDCVPDPDWLQKMIEAHEAENCAGVGGAVLNGLPYNPIAWSGYLLEFSERLPKFPKGFVNFLPTCNVSFKRHVFESHGGFPTDVESSEDQLFSFRLISGGERLLFDPQIVVRHVFRSHFKDFVTHQRWLGKGSARARRQADLPHAWLARHSLRWLVPVIRLLVLEARFARWDTMNLLRFNLLLPFCLSGLIAWGVGFCSHQASTKTR